MKTEPPNSPYVNPKEWLILEPPKNRSMLQLAPKLVMYFPSPKPSWWVRLWQWLLLGWTWEDVKE